MESKILCEPVGAKYVVELDKHQQASYTIEVFYHEKNSKQSYGYLFPFEPRPPVTAKESAGDHITRNAQKLDADGSTKTKSINIFSKSHSTTSNSTRRKSINSERSESPTTRQPVPYMERITFVQVQEQLEKAGWR